VLVGIFNGEQVRLEEAHRFPNAPARVLDTLHWDVLRLWNDIEDGLRKVAAQHGTELGGIGVDTWGVDFGLLDANDQLLGNPVHYRDARNNGMMDAVFQTVPRGDVFASTGLQFLPFNTLFQMMALKTYNQPQLGIAETLLFMPDLLHQGQRVLDCLHFADVGCAHPPMGRRPAAKTRVADARFAGHRGAGHTTRNSARGCGGAM
jgi:rhamnulokinase